MSAIGHSGRGSTIPPAAVARPRPAPEPIAADSGTEAQLDRLMQDETDAAILDATPYIWTRASTIGARAGQRHGWQVHDVLPRLAAAGKVAYSGRGSKKWRRVR